MPRFDEAAKERIKCHDGIPALFAGVDGWKGKPSGGFRSKVFWRGGDDPTHLEAYRINGSGAWLFRDWTGGKDVDAITAVERLMDFDFKQAMVWLGDQLGVKMEADEDKGPALPPAMLSERILLMEQLYERAMPLDDGTPMAEYFRGRGLLEAARSLGVKQFAAGEPKNLSSYEGAQRYGLGLLGLHVRKRQPFAVYPSTVDGRIILQRTRLAMSDNEAKAAGLSTNHSTPSSMEGFRFPTVWPTLPAELAAGADVVLAEGETDAMALRMLVPGIQAYAICGSGRLGPNDPEFQALVKVRAKMTLAFQNDQASWDSITRLTEAFRKSGLTVTAYVPADGAKDWAETLSYGTDPVTSLASIGAVYGDYSVGRMIRASEKYADDMKSGRLKHISIPWRSLEIVMGGAGLPPGTLGLLSSRTGVGKSWLSFHLAAYAAAAGHKVFYLNTELQDSAVGARLLAIQSGIGSVASMADADLIKHLVFEYGAEISKMQLEVTQADPRMLDAVPDLLRDRIGHGARLLIIDHIGDLDCAGAESFKALPQFARIVRLMAHKRGVLILLVTHLRAGEAEDILAFSRQIENIVDYSWALQGYEPRRAMCRKDGINVEREINKILVVRKSRFGRSEVKIAMNLNSESLALEDCGRFNKWASKEPAMTDWTR